MDGTTPSRRVLRGAEVLWLVTALGAVAAVGYLVVAGVLDGDSPVHLGDVVKGWETAVLNPYYWLFVALILLAERLWPAERGAGSLTTGGATDLVWLLLAPVFTLTIVALYLGGLEKVWTGLLDGAQLDVVGVVGLVPAAIAAFLLADFTMWLTHFIRHKVPLFWRFHAVHHSQLQLGVLSDNRVHFVEAIVSATIVYIPARLLGLADEAAAILAIGTVFFTGFTHANLRTNMGPLRWLFVTPQSHRIHHSNEPQHFDHNFGAILSIWDRIFRTQWVRADEYPSTGIDDQSFPVEAGHSPLSALRFYLLQLVYPFRGLVRRRPAQPAPAPTG
jgi:sterol desaturase/sphingolipid hydroxylase (fatty acid hydroxylase superfamily)